jgi:hypothetical protein
MIEEEEEQACRDGWALPLDSVLMRVLFGLENVYFLKGYKVDHRGVALHDAWHAHLHPAIASGLLAKASFPQAKEWTRAKKLLHPADP